MMTTKAAVHPQQMRTISIVPIALSVSVTLFILTVPGKSTKYTLASFHRLTRRALGGAHLPPI